MTDDSLVELLIRRNAARREAVQMVATSPRPRRAAASITDVLQAERELQLQFPNLLRRLYLEVADGNFGPGYGLFPLTGETSVITETLDKRDLGGDGANAWRNDLLCICTFGCTFYAAVDCQTESGAVCLFEEHHGVYSDPAADSLNEWLTAWVESHLNPYGRVLPA